ncbi:MAG: ABC transporter ATP-binding protein [Sarcina sp.]
MNLEIKDGEMVAIMGPSGCGKSTLLNVLGCVDKQTSGNYMLDDIEVSKLSYDELADIRNKKIGFILQNFALINDFTVLENIILPLRVRKISKKDMILKAEDILKDIELLDKKNKQVNQLSGGQQQRIAIARTLVQETDIILADEPTGALDSNTGKLILDILKKVNKEYKKTIIIVTHDINVANSCDRIISMNDGNVM